MGVPLFPQLWDVGGSISYFEENVGHLYLIIALIDYTCIIGTFTAIDLIWCVDMQFTYYFDVFRYISIIEHI